MKLSKKVAVVGKQCVACGTCVSVCPRSAIWVDRGVIAKIDGARCVGCGKCAKICPADIILIKEREVTP